MTSSGYAPEPTQGFALTDANNVRYVKIKILSNYGSNYVTLSKVRFTDAIVDPKPMKLLFVGITNDQLTQL